MFNSGEAIVFKYVHLKINPGSLVSYIVLTVINRPILDLYYTVQKLFISMTEKAILIIYFSLTDINKIEQLLLFCNVVK